MKITIKFDASHITDAQLAESMAAVQYLSDHREHLATGFPAAVERASREGTVDGRR